MSVMGRWFVVAVLLVVVAGCRKDPAKGGASDKVSTYDPKKDPLVNPPSLLLPYPKDNPGIVEENEILVRLNEGNPKNLNPIFASSMYEQNLAEVLFDTLFSADEKMNWFVNESMVASNEESPDHLINTIKLQPGLKWQDGKPLTAHDIRFSWEALLDERVPVTAARSGPDQIADVKVIDDLTFQFVHKEALPTNHWNMQFPIIPKHIFGNEEERKKDPTLSNSDYYNRYNREVVIGNGPYKLVEWKANDQIVAERWDDFHGAKPHFKRLIFKIQSDRNVALLSFKKGELDEIMLTAQQFATQTNDEDFARHGVKGHAPAWTYSSITWNMDGSNPFFNDKNVRIAMAHALNIQELIRVLGYNLWTQCTGIFHPDSWMYNHDIKPLTYDLKKAAAMLDEAGWLVSDQDGWRYKKIGDQNVKFEFEMMIPQGSSYGEPLAAIYGEDLKKIGISLKTRIYEWATFLDNAVKHEFQAEIAAWGTGTDPDTNWNLWRSEEYKNGRNYGGYSNKRVDELFDLARHEFDTAKRADYYREIQKLIYDDQGVLFLWNRSTTWGFHKRLQGIMFSPREVFGFDPSFKAWWVSKTNSLRK